MIVTSRFKDKTNMITSALKSFVLLLALAGPLSNALKEETYECSTIFTPLTAGEGYLSISRSASPCGFLSKQNTSWLAIETDSLSLYPSDVLTLEAMDTMSRTRNVSGPQQAGYIVIGSHQPKLTFNFDATKPNTTMKLKFYQQTGTPLQISGDKKKDLVIQSFGEKPQDLKVSIQKSTVDTVYLETIGTEEFGHYLVEKNEQVIDLGKTKSETFIFRISPVLKNCSGYHETKDENSFEIDGPSATLLDTLGEYTCVHIFKTVMTGRAHFDVDFKDFIEMLDSNDQLSINDGSQSLIVSKSSSKYYKELVPNISFKGKELVVVYDSPQKISRLSLQFKLTVHARSQGGIVDAFNYEFDIPAAGSAYYSFKTPPNSSENVALEFDKFSGAEIKIFNRQNNVITINTALTAVIPLPKPDDSFSVQFSTNAKTKVSGTVKYQPGTGCGGILFEPSGALATTGSNKSCHWFLGAASNIIKVNLNNLRADGGLKILDVKRQATVFDKKNLEPTDVLPSFHVDGQAYLKINLGKSANTFDASVSAQTETLVSTANSFQHNYTSVGYPTYFWSATSESSTIDFSSLQVVFSVLDVDLRNKEVMTIGTTNIVNGQPPSDIYFKDEKAKIAITRPGSDDYSPRRGYKLVVTQFQSVILADMKKSTVKTPSNLTSVLLKVPAAADKRISYDITFSNTDKNYVIDVLDSRSLMGRPVDKAEKFKGTTTSNVLLVNVRSTKSKVFLPEITVNYGEAPCNRTKDHVCDGATRCVPASKMCKGVSYCLDGSDLKVPCSNGPVPPPKVINNNVSGVTVFIISVLMFVIGAITALYGPDLYKNLETRYRSGQYTTFQSAE